MASHKARGVGHRAVRRTLVGGLMGALGLCVVALVVVVETGWLRIDPIMSGSMRPGLPVGGVAIAERVPRASLRVGDVLFFTPPWAPGTTDVHRIISLRRSGGGTVIRTRGDANAAADPIPVRLLGRWVYEVRGSLPFVGYAAVWLHSAAAKLELSLGVLLGAVGITIWSLRARHRPVGQAGAQGDPSRGDRAGGASPSGVATGVLCDAGGGSV